MEHTKERRKCEEALEDDELTRKAREAAELLVRTEKTNGKARELARRVNELREIPLGSTHSTSTTATSTPMATSSTPVRAATTTTTAAATAPVSSVRGADPPASGGAGHAVELVNIASAHGEEDAKRRDREKAMDYDLYVRSGNSMIRLIDQLTAALREDGTEKRRMDPRFSHRSRGQVKSFPGDKEMSDEK